mmetsp:Transcript_57742/g.146506  ORF Transcript_57742/g.146506 Transcript_57742/m.146506 type:complete len:256 (-) Transcript_57742:36-803(-)
MKRSSPARSPKGGRRTAPLRGSAAAAARSGKAKVHRHVVKALHTRTSHARVGARSSSSTGRARASGGATAGGSSRGGALRGLTLNGPELGAAILGKQKKVENRSWDLPEKYHGEWIALHIGNAQNTPPWVRRYVTRAWDTDLAKNAAWKLRCWDTTDQKAHALPPRGAIIALIRFSGMHRFARGEGKADPWALGPVCWDLDRVVPLAKPICGVQGNLGFWDVRKQVKPWAVRSLKEAIRDADAKRGIGRFCERKS